MSSRDVPQIHGAPEDLPLSPPPKSPVVWFSLLTTLASLVLDGFGLDIDVDLRSISIS